MELIESLILGVVQGLTEFLPVSSSGHLELGKNIMGNKLILRESILFTMVLHFATAISTIIVFHKDVTEILRDLFKLKSNSNTQFVYKIIISMIPAVIIGFFLESLINSMFSSNIAFVGSMLIVTALLLMAGDRYNQGKKRIDNKIAFLIGISQAFALIPGISRSGATIATALVLGVDKANAAKFSFLMVLPIIFGKVIYDISFVGFNYDETQLQMLGIGFIAAFLSGLIACKWMISLVKNSQLKFFALYCTILGVSSILSFVFLK